MSQHVPAGTATGDSAGELIVLTPDDAGWVSSGLRVLRLAPGIAQVVRTADSEVFVLPLTGGLTIEITNESGDAETKCTLTGRASVFTRVTDFAYAGRDSIITLASTDGAEVAIPSARCDQRRPACYVSADSVPVEVRGAGPATRQVTNFGAPGAFGGAEKLICCELITPPGNWSSYPPHKHDATDPCEVVNEEIYYYRIAGADQITPSRDGFALHRTYTGPEHAKAGLADLDTSIEVRDGDVVLVPYGYHGPCVAAPGYPMYYLNVLAGPGPERSMAFCDDPAHAWIRGSWADMPIDPRCPVTSATGRVSDQGSSI
jgi:5-deoxy-glucuronate isomerase